MSRTTVRLGWNIRMTNWKNVKHSKSMVEKELKCFAKQKLKNTDVRGNKNTFIDFPRMNEAHLKQFSVSNWNNFIWQDTFIIYINSIPPDGTLGSTFSFVTIIPKQTIALPIQLCCFILSANLCSASNPTRGVNADVLLTANRTCYSFQETNDVFVFSPRNACGRPL